VFAVGAYVAVYLFFWKEANAKVGATAGPEWKMVVFRKKGFLEPTNKIRRF